MCIYMSIFIIKPLENFFPSQWKIMPALRNFLGKVNNKTLFCLLSICGNQVAEGVVELWAF